MIIITGAAGFIGSCLLSYFNERDIRDIILVDDFTSASKNKNLSDKKFLNFIDRNEFIDWFDLQYDSVDVIFHIGARTDTTEFDIEIFNKLNLHYSQALWERCSRYGIPFIYASSAATYGNGSLGYSDQHTHIPELKPLNPYGQSKQDFDVWALQQKNRPPYWYGLKFFNVYGPNEYHKGRMASVVFHAFNQIKEKGRVSLFRSHRTDYEDGKQLRDFIYVKDVINVLDWLYATKPDSGIYNLGTGTARTFLDLVQAVFSATAVNPLIDWVDIPVDIRDTYQYFTEADMSKLRSVGYADSFYTLEAGINDYVTNYLSTGKYY
ncbi:ADP-L-glycero-D-manno-heptose-6-epimerase [Bacteroidota bacterium]|nr:ADP-L-glycero-D-manno-heptose-6-epimerase [Bacteroidota bacterium]